MAAPPPPPPPPPLPPPRLLDSAFLDAAFPGRLAVIVLNRPLSPLAPALLARAALRLAADGGANRLHDGLPRLLPAEAPDAERARLAPHAVLGDLDSARPEVLDYYRDLGVDVQDLSADQMTTDLEKCLAAAAAAHAAAPLAAVVALGALGGRLDHTLAALAALHAFRELPIILIGGGNAARLVPAGRARLRPHAAREGPPCGLVPLAGPAVASSRGLRWELAATALRVGGLVSTSNSWVAPEIEVETDADLVWTITIREEGGDAAAA